MCENVCMHILYMLSVNIVLCSSNSVSDSVSCNRGVSCL